MANPFLISTESTADLPERLINTYQIMIHPLYYIMDNITYGQDVPFLDPAEFYTRLKAGSMPTTSASNPEAIREQMLEAVKAGYDILHIAFSSGLSSSYQNTLIAVDDIRSEYPDANIIVIDSLAASAGQGLLVHKAVMMKESGKSMEEIAAYLLENRLHVVHSITVDDLFHLYRGGRLSKTSALLGSALKIKPLIHVNEGGCLINVGKVRNRQKALNTIADEMKENIEGYQQDLVYISHSNCYEDAKYLAERINALYGIDNIIITDMTPVIGSHTGTGCVALFYLGKNR